MPSARAVRMAAAAALAALAGLVAVALPARAEAVAEPEGYRAEPYRAPVPDTVEGRPALTVEEAEALWRAGAAFIDVLPRTPKPANLPPGVIWRDKPHRTIPGALWLPNTGYQALAPEEETYLRRGLEAATAGDRAAPVVIFCLAECWMSWNAVKRARAMGWSGAEWFASGMDAWNFMDLPSEETAPAVFD